MPPLTESVAAPELPEPPEVEGAGADDVGEAPATEGVPLVGPAVATAPTPPVTGPLSWT